MKKRLIIFASGSGSNAVNVCNQFRNHPQAEVVALFCNNPAAGVIEKMKPFGVPVELFNRTQFADAGMFLGMINKYRPDAIALLGFLWLMPTYLVKAYEGRILNLHPALLPSYGGKGMYGHHVHEAVIANREQKSGITLHQVNEHYDEGKVLAQFTCAIDPDDTAEMLASKIHALEQEHVPQVISEFLSNLPV